MSIKNCVHGSRSPQQPLIKEKNQKTTNQDVSKPVISSTKNGDRSDETGSGSQDRSFFNKKKGSVEQQDELQYCTETDNMPEPQQNEQELRSDEELSLNLNEPSPEIMEYARRELGETDEVKCQMIQELRDMVYERGECLPLRIDDDFLIRFLRARNFQLKRAHRLMVNYYNFKEEHPKINKQPNAKEMRQIGDDDVIVVPPYRNKCGRRIIIFRVGNWNPRKYPMDELFKAMISILELAVLEPQAQILGGIAIFDFKDITMSHALTVTPQAAKLILSLMVTSFPLKIHEIHILNQSKIFNVMFAVFKPLLDSYMRGKIIFHGNKFESLYKYISPDYLPKKYGGTRNELPYYKWITALLQDPKVIEEMKKIGFVITDEILESFKLI